MGGRLTQVLQNRAPPSCSLHGPPTPFSMPPHLTQANTSKSNVLLSTSAKVHSRRPLLHPLRSARCLLPRSRLLLTCLGEPPWLRGQTQVLQDSAQEPSDTRAPQ
jgi:hypothetical protein